MQSTWEEAHSSALRELYEKGVPFSEVARALNERFGTAYSRNAAIGRARRMGLSVPERAGPAGPFPAARKPDARRILGKRARKPPGARGQTRHTGTRRLTPTLISESFFRARRRQVRSAVRHCALGHAGQQDGDSRQRGTGGLCRAKDDLRAVSCKGL